MPAQTADDLPKRAIFLGASNVALALPQLVNQARSLLGPGPDVLIAAGHGRSYGAPSNFLVRTLPGIEQSGLWGALAAAPRAEAWALLADVGNDLAFGAPVERILRWVARALERLGPQVRGISVAMLPLARLERLGRLEFELWRRVLFPSHRLQRDRLLADARALDAGLRELAHVHAARCVEAPMGWYGRDPIHVRRSQRARAAATWLEPWREAGGKDVADRGRIAVPAAWRLVPERRWWLGRTGGVPQPCAVLRDGTRLSLF